MIKCSISGRKRVVLHFLQKLKTSGCCAKFEVQYPEAFKFCGDRDITCVDFESSCTFLDFNLLKERSFRFLTIQLQINGYSFKKKRGFQKLELVGEKPCQPALDQETDGFTVKRSFLDSTGQVEEISDAEQLNDFETLELFEERLWGKNDS